MDWATATQIATLLAGGAVSTSAIALMTARDRRAPAMAADAPGATPAAAPEGAVFLLRGDDLVDATAAARLLLARRRAAGSDLEQVLAALAARFPTLAERLPELSERKRIDLSAADGGARLEAEWHAGLARLRLVDNPGPRTGGGYDAHALGALLAELDDLRGAADNAAVPIWRTGVDGATVWANRAYLDLADRVDHPCEVPRWPPAAVFEGLTEAAGAGSGRRMPVALPGTGPAQWFRIHGVDLGDGVLFTAVPEDQTVAAEKSLSSFVQTMSNTFASLTVGLAIFDSRRVLTLFNPALMELTELPADFLTARPSLVGFLDRLRDQRMAPEPKDYRSWRRQIAELENAAADGSYSEIWPLMDGRTYRVDGRPHHDGAIAFVFEDISSEISLTRRFRAEIETGQAVIDSLDEAVAVFSSAGVMTLSNRAYADLWGGDPMRSVKDDVTFLDATRTWHSACVPTPVWGDARDFAGGLGERANWSAEVRMRDGRRLSCRFEPIAGGATLAGFRPLGAGAAAEALPASGAGEAEPRRA